MHNIFHEMIFFYFSFLQNNFKFLISLFYYSADFYYITSIHVILLNVFFSIIFFIMYFNILLSIILSTLLQDICLCMKCTFVDICLYLLFCRYISLSNIFHSISLFDYNRVRTPSLSVQVTLEVMLRLGFILYFILGIRPEIFESG